VKSSVLYKPTFSKLALFLGPGILLYGFIVIVPLIGAFWYSLHNDTNNTFRFVGLRNYTRLLGDGDFWFAFRNNLIILGLSLVLQLSVAFIIATMMNGGQIRMARFYRVVLFLPVVLSSVVVGFIWILIYNINYGLLNTFFTALGLSSWSQLWLDNPNLVIYSVTIPLMWQFIGFYLVIFLAGFSAIPNDLLEAAEIDGANALQKTLHITLPLLVNTWRVVLILAVSGAIKVFEQPFVMTEGGPGISSTVLAQYAYNMSFVRQKLSYGSTVAVGMLVLSFVLIALSLFIINKLLVGGRDRD
jgi:raffinose/stachyose/melibiose transport system permease protein